MGLVAHGTYLYEDLTALENLRFWTGVSGQAWRADDGDESDRADESDRGDESDDEGDDERDASDERDGA
jgi:ABC-type multidrug transport system ATPase subunit